MNDTSASATTGLSWSSRFAPLVRAFHTYASWLVSISWKRFFLLSLLLLLCSAVLQSLPPFSWKVSETIETRSPRVVIKPTPPKPPAAPGAAGTDKSEPVIKIERSKGKDGGDVEISIGSHGIRITPNASPKAASAAEAAGAAASAAQAAERAVERVAEARAAIEKDGIRITVPPGAAADAVREAIEQAKRDIKEAVDEARADAEEAKRDAEQAIAELSDEKSGPRTVVRHTKFGEPLPELAFFWIFASMIMKISYKGQL